MFIFVFCTLLCIMKKIFVFLFFVFVFTTVQAQTDTIPADSVDVEKVAETLDLLKKADSLRIAD